MVMICNIPDDVIRSVKTGTWPGSFVVVDMVLNGIPLDKIRTEIKNLERFEIGRENTSLINGDNVLHILDKCKTEIKPQESEENIDVKRQ